MGCIYTEAKNYPREPATHVAISELQLLLNAAFALFLPAILICGEVSLWFVNNVYSFSFLSYSRFFPFSGTVRRFLEKQKDKLTAVVFCTTTDSDTEIYQRLFMLFYPSSF